MGSIGLDLYFSAFLTFWMSLQSRLKPSGSRLAAWSVPFQVLSNVKCLSIHFTPKVTAAMPGAIPRWCPENQTSACVPPNKSCSFLISNKQISSKLIGYPDVQQYSTRSSILFSNLKIYNIESSVSSVIPTERWILPVKLSQKFLHLKVQIGGRGYFYHFGLNTRYLYCRT